MHLNAWNYYVLNMIRREQIQMKKLETYKMVGSFLSRPLVTISFMENVRQATMLTG